MQNSFIFKIEENNIERINEIRINKFNPIEDNNSNKLLINKVSLLNNDKILIETGYLKVKNICKDKKKLFLEINANHKNFFNKIDEKCKEVLQELINSDKEISTWNINWDFDKINYNKIISEDNDELKVLINTSTNIKIDNQNELKIEDIKEGDNVALLLGLDYISLLLNPLHARSKLYCYYLNISRPNKFISEERIKIDSWNFSSKKEINNIFIKTELNEDENNFFKTEIQKDHTEYNSTIDENIELNNKENLINAAKETEDIIIDNNKIKEIITNKNNKKKVNSGKKRSTEKSEVQELKKQSDIIIDENNEVQELKKQSDIIIDENKELQELKKQQDIIINEKKIMIEKKEPKKRSNKLIKS